MDALKIADEKLFKANTELQKADLIFEVICKKRQEAENEKDQTEKQMQETCKIACFSSASEEDKKVASAAFGKYSAVSAYCTQVKNEYDAARKRRKNVTKKYNQAYKNMIQAYENMKVVKQRFLGEDTESDSSDSDAL